MVPCIFVKKTFYVQEYLQKCVNMLRNALSAFLTDNALIVAINWPPLTVLPLGGPEILYYNRSVFLPSIDCRAFRQYGSQAPVVKLTSPATAPKKPTAPGPTSALKLKSYNSPKSKTTREKNTGFRQRRLSSP